MVAIVGRQRKKPGPAKTTGSGKLVGLRCHPDFLSRVDNWREQQPDSPTRPQAIMRLADLWLGFAGSDREAVTFVRGDRISPVRGQADAPAEVAGACVGPSVENSGKSVP